MLFRLLLDRRALVDGEVVDYKMNVAGRVGCFNGFEQPEVAGGVP